MQACIGPGPECNNILSAASLCLVCLCTYVLNRCARRGPCCLPVDVCRIPPSAPPGGRAVATWPRVRRVRVGPRQAWMGARNFLSCFFSTMDLKCPPPRHEHPESRERPVTRKHWQRHPRITVSLIPCHLQVEVKFQNKQRALFLEEMCYTQK